MKSKIPILTGLCCLIAIASVWARAQNNVVENISFNSISKSEVEMLLADVAKTNPKMVERLANDPDLKKQQIESLKQLLAYASQAKRDGLASSPTNRQELDNIRAEILAANYDREINKDKGLMPTFGWITDEQVKAYWSEKVQTDQADATERRTHEAEFNDFLNAKIAALKISSPEMKDREMSDDEKIQARDIFAKIRIYKAEYEQKVKSGTLSKEFVNKANLQVKLQQAQFLSRLYAGKVVEETTVMDDEVTKYIAVHPEMNSLAAKAIPRKPVNDYVREKLEADKEKQYLDKLVIDNNIQVPSDFDVPGVAKPQTPKELKKRPE